MKLIFLVFTFTISFVNCNRFAREMLYLSSFYYYNAYTEPIGFVRQLDLVANNYLALVKKINRGLDMELREASNYDLTSTNHTVNLEAAEVINKMQARQIVVDLMLFQINYCHKMYSNATAKFLGQKIVPLYEDLPFESRINRMIIYEWVNQMGIILKKISEMFEKTSENWKILREKINTTALGGSINGSASPTDGENKDPTSTSTTDPTKTAVATTDSTNTTDYKTANLTTSPVNATNTPATTTTTT